MVWSSYLFRVDSFIHRRLPFCAAVRARPYGLCRHVRRQITGLQGPGYTQRPGEGPSLLRLGETCRVNVQVRTPPRKAVPRIDGQAGDPGVDDRDDA